MKTLVCKAPKQFSYNLRARPLAGKGKAIIKIKRIGICGTDLQAYQGFQPFFRYPRIMGHELSGELQEFNDAPGFEKGDQVTFIPYFHCGKCIACRAGKPNCCCNLNVCGVHSDGGMVEFLSVPSYALVDGEGLDYDDLAMVEPLAIAAHAMRRCNLKEGEYVLVLGAGPIGLGILEFIRIGGGKPIVLEINEFRLAFCKNILQPKYTINAADPDVSEQLKEITNGDMPTVVIDATGNLEAIKMGFKFMAHGARYILVGLQKGDLTLSHPEFHKREATLMSSRNATREDFEYVISCIRAGKLNPKKFITHRVPFDLVKQEFESWLNPAKAVVKVMIELDSLT